MEQAKTMDSAPNVRVGTPGLDFEHFWQVGVRGLGDGQNSRANSMAWFKGRLYVGTARNFLSLTKRRGKALPAPKMECWPVVVRDPMPPEMLRAEIWSYDPAQDSIWSDDPAQDSWKRIYRDSQVP